MKQIRILPEDLINRIAAGEVVERPSSVVKELVENSLDAGASRVDVAIAAGGIRWISVRDNGEGMSPQNARLAFARHATSKIASAEALARVQTLGFRGEALASMASVARVRMRTRRQGEAIGTELLGEGAGIEQVREVACPEGTRVEIAELFARVPARRKFLKSAVTEARHIVRWLERIALAQPTLHLVLERDERSVLQFLPTREPRERVVAVLPPGVGDRLVPLAGEAAFARVHGFASPTDLCRGTTNDIHLFVNGRPVRDRMLLFAVRQAYRDALPSGRHPCAVLYLEIDPDQVDVNVHPAKWEVRFVHPDIVARLVRAALVDAIGLGSRQSPLPAPDAGWNRAGAGASRERLEGSLGLLELADRVDRADAAAMGVRDAVPGSEGERSAPLDRGVAFRSLRYLGQIRAAYLVFEGASGLVLLDQHAAHERVLFERMRQALFRGKIERQALLFPVWTELGRSSVEALDAQHTVLDRAGFEIQTAEAGVQGGIRVGLRSVPAILATRTDIDWKVLLDETAAVLLDPAGSETRVGLDATLHGVLATAACHAATRKGDHLFPKDVEGLLEMLDDTIWFPNCPHGRPILTVVGEAELERRFLRR